MRNKWCNEGRSMEISCTLYIYGGVYTDIDNSPTGFNGETIKDNDDSFFVIEKLGIMSQYFIASSFGHPLMAKMLEAGSERLKSIGNVMNNHAAQTTGPGACKVGFILFMKEAGVETNGYINAGVYFGENNRSVTVIGTKARSKYYVNRGGLDNRDKMAYYEALGIAHFSKRPGPNTGAFSCKEHLKRTNGTDKVANYRYVEELKAYVEVNTTVNTTVQTNIP